MFLYHPWHRLTFNGSIMYDIQKIIIANRSMNLYYKAYQGMDSTKNKELPTDLVRNIKNYLYSNDLENLFDEDLNLVFDPVLLSDRK